MIFNTGSFLLYLHHGSAEVAFDGATIERESLSRAGMWHGRSLIANGKKTDRFASICCMNSPNDHVGAQAAERAILTYCGIRHV